MLRPPTADAPSRSDALQQTSLTATSLRGPGGAHNCTCRPRPADADQFTAPPSPSRARGEGEHTRLEDRGRRRTGGGGRAGSDTLGKVEKVRLLSHNFEQAINPPSLWPAGSKLSEMRRDRCRCRFWPGDDEESRQRVAVDTEQVARCALQGHRARAEDEANGLGMALRGHPLNTALCERAPARPLNCRQPADGGECPVPVLPATRAVDRARYDAISHPRPAHMLPPPTRHQARRPSSSRGGAPG